jgi:DNA-binding MarR family transcriptional regulator
MTEPNPDVTDVNDDVVQILIAFRHLQQVSSDVNADAAETLSLSRTQFQAVSHLSVHGSITSRQLADALNLTPGSVTKLVSQLVDMKLVQRSPGHDRREVILGLTTQGMETANAVGIRYWRAVTDGVAPQERKTTLAALRNMTAALARIPGRN